MRFWGQLKLVLWKNFTLRKRQHLRNLIELLWPLLLFLILVGVRTRRQPEHRSDVLYKPRALPSAGLLVFMQSFICDFKSNELDPEHSYLVSNGLPNISSSGLLRIFQDAGPLLLNGSFRNHLLRLNTDYQKWVQDNQALSQLLGRNGSSWGGMNLSDVPLDILLKDPAEFQQFLLNTTKLDPKLVSELMNSRVDVQKVMDVFQPIELGSSSEGLDLSKLLLSANSQQLLWIMWLLQNYNNLHKNGLNGLNGMEIKEMFCDEGSPIRLQHILISPNGQSLDEVDKALCSLRNPDLVKLGRELQTQLTWPNATDIPGEVNSTVYRQLQQALREDLRNLSLDLEALQDLDRVVSDYVALRSQLRGRNGLHKALCNQASIARESGGRLNLQELGAGAIKELVNTNDKDDDKEQDSENKKKDKKDQERSCVEMVRDDYGRYRELLSNKSYNADTCSVIEPRSRIDCGWPSISESQCRQMDCCFDASVKGARFCFFKVENAECNCLFNQLVRGIGGVSGNPGRGSSDKGFVKLSSLFLRGKILFAPDNSVTRRILSEVKKQFSAFQQIEGFSEWWLNNSDLIRETVLNNTGDTSNYQTRLQNVQQIRRVLNFLPDLRNMSSGKIMDFVLNLNNSSLMSNATNTTNPLANVSALLDSVDSTLRQFVNLYKCSSHEYFEGYPDEKSLENRAVNESALPVIASLVFENVEDPSTGLPTFVKYKIRQDIDYTPRTDQIRYRYWRPGPRDGFSHNRYLNFGFMYLQDLIDRSLMNFMLNETVLEPGLYMQQLPYPCYINDRFVWYLSAMMPLFMTLAWVFSVAMIVKGIVYEKERRLKEVMKVMGMSTSVHWVAWFINSCGLMSISVLMLTVLLKWGQLLLYSNPVIIVIFLLVFMIATVMMCFLISVFFSRANLAAACGGIIFFVTYLPYMLVRWFEMFMNTSDKAVASLSSTTAFSIACSYLSRWEEQGVGAQWSNLYSSPISGDGFSLGFALAMMMVDAVIYGLLTWYIEAIMPGQYGIPRPWYFPFMKSYWFDDASLSSTRSHAQFSNTRNGHVYLETDSPRGGGSAGLDEVFFSRDTTEALAIEKEPTHLPLGVSIQNLVKIYSEGNKLAVDGLSLNLYENQITSFLGHNGAGKTTTMSVLSGLFPPTSGTAVINGHDIRTDMDVIRRSLGICPQYNVLFDGLSVEEHLHYYASLKGMAKENIPAEVDSFLHDVGLVEKRHELACNLSGGMKRKLSVAMAFVAGSKVVILDEPTAGVDPYARRGIWDLLLQYKPGRTVLLSTHHMDEADVLGDRIAIISQGKLQCCGTSLFLKSHYGNGYYVTLTKKAPGERPNTAKSLREVTLKVKDTSGGSQASSYDEGVGLDSVDASDRGSIESLPLEPNPDPHFQDTEMYCNEATVTSFIKSYIPCAQLVEHIGSDMTYVLPTEAAREGRFQDLFEELDKNLGKLHIGTYGVSDTTLEEVFLKVAADSNAEEEDQMAAEVPKRRPSFRGRMQFRRTRIANSFSDTAELLDESEEDADGESEIQLDGPRRSCGTDFDVDRRLGGLRLLKQQFWALLVKRFNHSRRNRKAFLSQILLPAIFVCLAMFVSQIRPFSEMPAIELSTNMFVDNEPHESHVFFSVDDPRSTVAKSMAHTLTKYPGVGSHCLEDKSCRRNIRVKFNKARPLYVNSTVNCDCSSGESKCPEEAGGPSPPEWTSHTEDILQDLTGRNLSDYLSKTYKKFIKKRYGGVSFGDNFKNLPSYYAQTNSELVKRFLTEHNAKVWYNNKGYHAMPTFLNVLNNAILRSKAKAKGWNASEFGIRVTNHPMIYNREQLNDDTIYQKVIDVLVAICVVFAMCFIPSSFVVFLVVERVNKAKHLHLVSGVRPYIYWLANYVWDVGNYIIPALLCCLVFLAFGEDAYTSAANFPPCFLLLLLYGWAITPLMYPASYLFDVPSTAYIALICANLFVGINTTLATFILEFFQDDEDLIAINEFLKKIFLIFPNYCLGRGLIDLAKNQFMVLFSRFGENLFRDPFSWDITGRNILALFIQGFVFFAITVLIEYKFFIRPRRVFVAQKPDPDEDEDVQQERMRVNRGDGKITDALRLENLTKVYESRQVRNVAVNHLCVGVPRGECFGLLGVNGAGKTSTFKMLTGDIPVTSGGAYVMGNSILSSIHDAHQAMGYCPQFDGLDAMLTAREHLQLYARLRGVPEDDVRYVVDSLIRKMNLVQYQDRRAGEYSGGNKRKLSTAIALVGNPAVVFLDEPTTGMDPKARRFLWNIITSIVKEGRTVILTSHSMEECEALCSRVAIMVNGQFKCLGSPQHLKNKYGDGYTVTMRVAGTNPNLDAVSDFMTSLFPGAVLKDKHHNSLEYQLPSRGLRLSSVFGHLEANRKIFDIEDYSVSQTTLDQVFINFAKNQKDAMDRDTRSAQAEFGNVDTSATGNDNPAGNYVRMVDVPLGEIDV